MKRAAQALRGVTFFALTLPGTRGLLPSPQKLRFTSYRVMFSLSWSITGHVASETAVSFGQHTCASADASSTKYNVTARRRRRRPRPLSMRERENEQATLLGEHGRDKSSWHNTRTGKVSRRRRPAVQHRQAVRMDGDISCVCDAMLGAAESGKRNGVPPAGIPHTSMAMQRLTREEEAALGEDVQRWQRLERLREDGMGVEAWASAAGLTVADLLNRVERGTGARERLVLSHLRLIMYLARTRGWSTAFSQMDLVQEGAMALHAVAAKYDPSRGVRLFSYAGWAVRVALEEAEAGQSGAVELPRYLHVRLRRLRAVVLSETAALGRAPTNKELAEAMGTEQPYLERLLRLSKNPSSTEYIIPSGVSLGDVIPGPQVLEDFLERLDAEAILERLLRKLSPREAEVILHRYGLFGREPKSVLGIAALMGITRQYVTRIQKSALYKMRGSLGEPNVTNEGIQRQTTRRVVDSNKRTENPSHGHKFHSSGEYPAMPVMAECNLPSTASSLNAGLGTRKNARPNEGRRRSMSRRSGAESSTNQLRRPR